MRNKLGPVVTLPMLAVMAACAAPTVQNPTPVSALQPATAEPRSYFITPGDVMDIKFFFNPELNEEDLVVRPDGRISLQLVGEQQAAGLTPGDFERQLEQAYARELRNPEIAVVMSDFATQQVFVDGQVGEPQMLPLAGPMTALQAVASAGGFLSSASREDVLLIRRDATGGATVTPLDLHAVLEGRDMRQDVVLQPFDVLFVPRSTIADINLWVEQYIRNNIPIPIGAGYALN